MASINLPPGCGRTLDEPLLYNEYQQRFQRARRMRFCFNCKTLGQMDENSQFTCIGCGHTHNGRWGNLTAPRAFNRFMLLAGRGGGKTLVGAHAVREELLIPDALWWVLGPTYKILHDSTFPTLVGLIPPSWVKKWDSEHMEITLKNGAMVAFRSLEDPDRARGPHGVAGVWFDEAAQSPERAYHVAMPMLIKAGGIVIASTTPLGFDWTYDQLEKKALIEKEPGYWAATWFTEHNPMFRSNPTAMLEIERARKTMTPEMFDQEYRGRRSNAQGLIYGALIIEQNELKDDEAIRKYIPEWPNVSPSRKILIGLDEGGDHPAGAVMIVVTELGLVVVAEFLERMRAHSEIHDQVLTQFGLIRYNDKVFAANKNALNLRLEWALKGTGVIKAENDQKLGIDRVQSWLLTKQLKFAYTVPKTIGQMKAYRWAENIRPETGEKKDKEKVFKLKDELPDGIRYALLSYPELPNLVLSGVTDEQRARLDAFSPKVRRELEILAENHKRHLGKGVHLEPTDEGYPAGNIFQQDVTESWMPWG